MKKLNLSKNAANMIEAIILITCLALAFLLNFYAADAKEICHQEKTVKISLDDLKENISGNK